MSIESNVDPPKSADSARISPNSRRWILALAVAAAIVLPVVLFAHHRATRAGGNHVGGYLFAWLILAGVVRLIILAITSAAPSAGARMRPRPTARAQAWTARYAVLALVGVWLLSLGIAVAIEATIGSVPKGGIGALIIDAIFLSALIPLYVRGRLRPVDLGIRPAPRGIAVGAALLGLVAVTVFGILWRYIAHLPRIESNIAGLQHRSTAVIILTGVALCASAPIAEEIFFRGLLYRSLRNRLPVLPAAVIIGVIFGLGHTQYPLLERPEQAVFGITACLMYERTGSLLPSIALHSFIDSSAFEFALTKSTWVVDCSFMLFVIVLLAGPPTINRVRRTRAGSRMLAT
jgi:membrane protease YdiL (CAAX protease family)